MVEGAERPVTVVVKDPCQLPPRSIRPRLRKPIVLDQRAEHQLGAASEATPGSRGQLRCRLPWWALLGQARAARARRPQPAVIGVCRAEQITHRTRHPRYGEGIPGWRRRRRVGDRGTGRSPENRTRTPSLQRRSRRDQRSHRCSRRKVRPQRSVMVLGRGVELAVMLATCGR